MLLPLNNFDSVDNSDNYYNFPIPVIQQCQDTIDLFYRECKEFEDLGSKLDTYFKGIAKEEGLILPEEVNNI